MARCTNGGGLLWRPGAQRLSVTGGLARNVGRFVAQTVAWTAVRSVCWVGLALLWSGAAGCSSDRESGRKGIVKDGSVEALAEPHRRVLDAATDANVDDGSVVVAQLDGGSMVDAGPVVVDDDAALPVHVENGADAEVVASPCDSCAAELPHCIEEQGQCVACLLDEHCQAAASGPFCVRNQCVACRDNADCTSPNAPRCDGEAHVCTGCVDAADCGMVQDGLVLGVCDVQDGACVQCTAQDYASCGVGRDGSTPFVCDSRSRRCSTTLEGKQRACQSCVSDAACTPGQACVLENYKAQPLGYVCQLIPGGEASPGSCGLGTRPYFRRITDATSIDGKVVDVCVLDTSTCEAHNHFRARSCAGLDDGAACGTEGLDDGVCRPSDPSSTEFVCSMRCATSGDCPLTFACDVNDVIAGAVPEPHCMFYQGSCSSPADCDPDQVCVDGLCQGSGLP